MAADRNDEVDRIRIVLRPIASALPLGFFAFAVGSLQLTSLELGWAAPAESPQIALVLLCFVVPLQLTGMLIAIVARDVGGATALGILGTTWLTFGVYLLTGQPGATSTTLGLFLLCDAVVLTLLAGAAAMERPLFGLVLLLGTSRFALTGVFELTPHVGLEHVSGWLGLPLSLAALYLALALLVEDARKGTILPLLRRGAARRSIESPFADQVRDIHNEAGVRNQL